MKNILFRFFKNLDFLLLGATLLLLSFGLAVLFSATTEYTLESRAVQQGINIVLGLLALFFFARLDYRLLKSYVGILYLVVVVMLVVVKVFGLAVGGAERWISLGFFQLQPSTLSLLLMVIILAKYFSDHYEEMGDLRVILKSGIYVAIPAFLIAWQPDFGSAALLVFIWAVMLFASNAKRIHLAVMGVLVAFLTPLSWFFMRDYQRERLLTFFNPAADPAGAGWNVNQAMIAIGSGQVWGRGLGHGTQSQLDYVPEKHTDFIFAMTAEEMGFVGVSILLSLFLLLIYRSVRTAVLARDFFGTYLAVGISAMLFVHILVSVGMNLGVMPVTGIPLPFISYGGTAVIVNLVAVGLLLSIYRRYKKIDF